MNMKLAFLSTSILISIVSSQNTTSTPGPVIPPIDISEKNYYGNCGTVPDDTFAFLEDAERPFCFKFMNALTSDDEADIVQVPYTRFYYFGTRVDKYTLVALSGSNLGETANAEGEGDNWRVEADVGVQFEAGNVTSSTMLARKWDPETQKYWIFTQLSIVIVVKEGHVDEVVWDDGCYSCAPENCIDGNCAIPQDECQAGTNKCDFTCYISWYGSDTNDRYLLSAGQRLSQFSDTSAKSYYEYVRNNLDTDLIRF